ncbi:MAG: YigZ family protein [Eubacteriales bacterium]|nr:YigZ family protein [Eubacteriales bacterium]
MKKSFKTINTRATSEIIEKKSKFIANVCPVKSEEEAISFISEIKKQHYNARHNCFAYIINGQIPIMRFSDDGEPSGTAGKPILDVLTNECLENIVVVVTRYFGGILLGTGGLVRAYGKSAKEGVIAGKIVEIDLYSTIYISCDYSISGKIQYEIENSNFILFNTEYTDMVKFTVYVNEAEKENFKNHIINISNNQAVVLISETIMLKLIDGKICLN